LATCGSVSDAAGWYLLGAVIGPARMRGLVWRHGRWVVLSPALYDRMAAAFRRHPFGVTFIGQLLPTIRIYQAVPAGVLRLPLMPLLVATGAGSLCWILPLVCAGHVLRRFGWSPAEAGLALLGALLSIEGLAFLSVLRRMLASMLKGASSHVERSSKNPSLTFTTSRSRITCR
jgi:membrane protein DedA with SNARE-associated domain